MASWSSPLAKMKGAAQGIRPSPAQELRPSQRHGPRNATSTVIATRCVHGVANGREIGTRVCRPGSGGAAETTPQTLAYCRAVAREVS